MLSSQLPRPLQTPIPPDKSQRQRILILSQHSRLIRQKKWPVTPVPPIFNSRDEPFAKLIFIGPRNFFQSLRSSTEQTSTVRQIFTAPRQRYTRSPLKMRVSRSPIHMRRSRRLPRRCIRPLSRNHIITFQRERQLRACIPRRITIKDVLLPIRSRRYRSKAKPRLHRCRTAIRSRSDIRMILPNVIIHRPRNILRRL